MAYAVDWITREVVISVSDLVLVSGTRYQLLMSAFLAECRRLEWAFSDGLWAQPILDHTNAKLDFAGADYAGFDEVVNSYTVTFSAPATRVDLIGSNNNIIDVLNVNGISIVPSNSAGLQRVETGVSGLTEEESAQLNEVHGRVEQRIYIDTELVPVGDGSQQVPYNNWSSGVDDAEANHILKLSVLSDADVDRQLKNFDIIGVGLPTLDLSGNIMDGSRFFECNLTGNYTGSLVARDSKLTNLSGLNGVFHTVTISGIITIGANAKLWKLSAATSDAPYAIDMNGITEASATVTEIYDIFSVQNIANVNSILHIHGGDSHITIDASCIDGVIHIIGDHKVTNNAVGATVHINNVQVDPDVIWNHIDAKFLLGIVKNLKEIKKVLTSWYIIVYDVGEVSGGAEILRKKLTDSAGDDITDLQAGTLAAELETSV